MTMSFLTSHENGVVITVYIQPRASRNRIHGPHGNALKIAITAPPVDNKANAAVIAFLAKLFDLPKSAVLLMSGQQNRSKRLLLSISLEKAQTMIDRELAR